MLVTKDLAKELAKALAKELAKELASSRSWRYAAPSLCMHADAFESGIGLMNKQNGRLRQMLSGRAVQLCPDCFTTCTHRSYNMFTTHKSKLEQVLEYDPKICITCDHM